MATWTTERHRRASAIFRHSDRDAVFVGLSIAHAALLLAAPSVPLVAIGLWWNANTIAHNFIHRPFFRSAPTNHVYSAFLSLVLGLPQQIWRERHLAHHADRPVRVRWSRQLFVEIALVGGLWTTMALVAPATFMLVYLPGWAIGLGICALQGHYEHAGGTTSHYGKLYNLLFFNDGYHVEHHARPGAHWADLAGADTPARTSRWPPVLRWLDDWNLQGLERIVLRFPPLQRFVLARHRRAFAALLPRFAGAARVLVVGGGMYPRTALLVRELLPDADIHIVDADASHLDLARPFLDHSVRLTHARFDPLTPVDADLIVTPLAYIGNRRSIYEHAPAPRVLVHDWIWHRRGEGVVVSWLLLKRLNVVIGAAEP
jgi:hypothetical protein